MLKTFKLTLQKQQLGGKYRSFTTSTSTSSSPPQTPTKILISPLIDPYFNKAIEDFHLSHTKLKAGEQLLYLWQNEPTVFIGRNQNPWKECHLNFMEEDKVHLVRRFTGGGAVYQDLGNLNWSFFQHKSNVNVAKNLEMICQSLSPLPAVPTGRNDISINHQKVSGSAFRFTRENHLHHGTILFDVNIDRMQKYLNVNKEKLISKGVESVRSRVVNIKSLDNNFSIDLIRNNIISQFKLLYGPDVPIEIIDVESFKEDLEFIQIHSTLQDWKWVYGETPNFQYSIEKRFEDWGIMDLNINSKDGVITDVKLFSDSLYPEVIDQIAAALRGVKYSKEEVWETLIRLSETLAVGGHPSSPFIQTYANFLRNSL